MRPLALLPAVLCWSIALAQLPDPRVWRPLTDSVFMVLHLDEDQIQRTRVIDDHYNEERHKLDTQALAITEQDRALSRLAAAREKEVQGVMTHDQFEQWIQRPRPATRPSTNGIRGR